MLWWVVILAVFAALIEVRPNFTGQIKLALGRSILYTVSQKHADLIRS